MLLILSMVFAVSCSKSNGGTFKIGVNYWIIGRRLLLYGQSSVEGIELAIEQINEAWAG